VPRSDDRTYDREDLIHYESALKMPVLEDDVGGDFSHKNAEFFERQQWMARLIDAVDHYGVAQLQQLIVTLPLLACHHLSRPAL
jgi:hypothetical protein